MIYSLHPYDAYGLQYSGGLLSPLGPAPGDGEWNLHWLTIPLLDAFQGLAHGNFEGYKALLRRFPYRFSCELRRELSRSLDLCSALGQLSPREVYPQLMPILQRVIARAGAPGDMPVSEYLPWVEHRIDAAQSLLDAREAAEICRNILVVDFKARRPK